MNALSALCQRRLGFDPARLSEPELRQALPAIIQCVAAEYAFASRQLVEVRKAARLHVQTIGEYVPNGDYFMRAESLSVESPDPDHSDPNAVLESVLPIE